MVFHLQYNLQELIFSIFIQNSELILRRVSLHFRELYFQHATKLTFKLNFRTDFKKGVQELWSNRNIWLCTIGYALPNGIVSAWQAVMVTTKCVLINFVESLIILINNIRKCRARKKNLLDIKRQYKLILKNFYVTCC